jgi:hypothetical protein
MIEKAAITCLSAASGRLNRCPRTRASISTNVRDASRSFGRSRGIVAFSALTLMCFAHLAKVRQKFAEPRLYPRRTAGLNGD